MNSVQVISYGVTAAIAALVLFLVKSYQDRRDLRSELPGAVSSLGVLGTFIGIIVGLLDFNAKDLEASVPDLLNGLKTAFITSIFGMGAALYLKRRYQMQDERAERKSGGASIATMCELLGGILQSSEQNAKQLANLSAAISGDNEGTIHTQLIKIRTGVQDKQDELIKEFRIFAETMAENNSKAFIQALEQVIRDFNTKISEQFGDNFKQLNIAVGQLLEWQKEYKSQVENAVTQLKQSAGAIETVRVSFESIESKSSSYIDSAQSLSHLLTEIKKTQDLIERDMHAFADVASKATDMMPRLETALTKSSEDVGRLLRQTIETTTKLVEEQHRAVDKQIQSIASASQKLNEGIESTVQRTSGNIQRLVDENGKVIQRHVEQLDKTLEEELKKALTSLGRQLASLSEKFVEDYTPLTERLNALVRIAEKGNGKANG